MSKYILEVFFLFFIFSCSSEPKKNKPDWVSGPTRLIDNGYIVYVCTGEGMGLERAQFKAEGQALEDLANECSMIPKGTRIEDRYSEKEKNIVTAYAKIGLEFQACESMKKSVKPEDIRKDANLAFTQQLKKYQDLTETGEMVSSNEDKVSVPSEMTEPPPRAPGTSDHIHFYVTRQYVAYQKEIVILSPPTAYAANSPESQRFVRTVEPTTASLQSQETEHPELKNHPQVWSKIPDRPRMERPQALSATVVKKIPSQKPAWEKPERGSNTAKGSKRDANKGINGSGKKMKKRKKKGWPSDTEDK